MTSERAGTTAGTAALAPAERQAIVRLARAALEAHFAGRRFEPDVAAPPPLREKRGAFVTLHRAGSGELRGCVGLLRSEKSLGQTVAEMAVASATADGRFAPVTADELPGLRIEVSALGPMHAIRPEDVVVGRDGLLITHVGRRGVLLPQVPVEHGWDRETFLEQVCGKAGLPLDAWRDPKAELLAFTAEVFGEEDEG